MNWLARLAGRRGLKQPAHSQEVLNEAMDIALEWGSWLSPIQDRLAARRPAVSRQRLDELNGTCHAAVRFGLEIALRLSRDGGGVLKERFDAEVLERYPWLDDENRERMFRHCVYHATKTARVTLPAGGLSDT